jgi:hypothetical protein
MKKDVEALIKKAAQTDNPAHAQQFAQAALNAANALCVLGDAKLK